MKILITGAAGAIGSHLAERLVQEGHEVIGIDALTDYYDPRLKKFTAQQLEEGGVKMKYLNLLDEEALKDARSVDVIFHLAAQPGISSQVPFENYLDNNIIATHLLVSAAEQNPNLQAFINTSTSSVYGAFANGDEKTEPKPTSWYGVTKLASEQLALAAHRDRGLPVVNLRLFSVLGERERPEKFFHKLIKSIYEDSEITLHEGSLDHVRSYTYVGDIMNGCILALKKRDQIIGETFNLGNDKTNTTGEGLRLIEEIMGKKAKIKVTPKRSGDQLETGAKIDKARKLLGYNPETDFRVGLEQEARWYGEFIHGKF